MSCCWLHINLFIMPVVMKEQHKLRQITISAKLWINSVFPSCPTQGQLYCVLLWERVCPKRPLCLYPRGLWCRIVGHSDSLKLLSICCPCCVSALRCSTLWPTLFLCLSLTFPCPGVQTKTVVWVCVLCNNKQDVKHAASTNEMQSAGWLVG